MLELARKVINIVGADGAIEHRIPPVDDPVRWRPNIDRARELLGWQPTVGLDEASRVPSISRMVGGARNGASVETDPWVWRGAPEPECTYGQSIPTQSASLRAGRISANVLSVLSERDMRPEHVIAGDSRLQSEVLEDLESAVNYRRWLCSLAYPYLGVNPIEIGSGLGHYASEWADAGFKLTASEADNARLKVLQDRFAHSDRVTVRHLAVPIDASPKYTAVVAYNVLEHIEDDVEALKSFAGLLQPYGAVILIVPAFQAALGDFDRAVGHFRRYRKRDLEAKLTAAGLAVKLTHYLNAPGLLIWYVAVRLLRQLPKRGVGLRIYDRLLVPMTWRVERRIRPPFGQSIFAVALRVDPRPPGSELRLQA